MSLRDAYSLAHTAQCRLNLEASRPDRNLRFVVGHLMHYESLRLRIVEIEHDISRNQRASAVQFKGNGHIDHQLRHKPSTGQLGKRSPPPPPVDPDDTDSDDTGEGEDYDAGIDDDEGGLGLTRFPSGTARPPQAPPALEPDDPAEDDYDDDEPVSPEEPDQATLESTLKGVSDEKYANLYEGVRKCPCHGHTDAPQIERVWQLPDGADGKTRMVAQVAAA